MCIRDSLKVAPKITDFLKKDSLEFYTKVKEYLDILGITYEEDPTLVRGLDYYSYTVWESVIGSGRTQDEFGSVSYTNLDGYKRQIFALYGAGSRPQRVEGATVSVNPPCVLPAVCGLQRQRPGSRSGALSLQSKRFAT